MNFDSNGAIANASIDQYLLEKIRLVSQVELMLIMIVMLLINSNRQKKNEIIIYSTVSWLV